MPTDPRSLIPLKIDQSYRDLDVTIGDIRKVIFSEQAMATTYVYGRFEKIFVDRQVPTAVTMMNKRSGRVSMVVNPDFIKKCTIGLACDRRHRQYRETQPRAKEFGGRLEVLSDPDALGHVKDLALLSVLKHEFGHIFFGHLENTDVDAPQFLTNLVQDSLINHHLDVSLGLNMLTPMSSRNIVVTALTDLSWAEGMSCSGSRRYYYHATIGFDFKDLPTLKYEPRMSPEEYMVWRIFNAMACHTGKGVGRLGLSKFLKKYIEGVFNYTETHADLVKMVQEAFPFLEDVKKHSCGREDTVIVIGDDEYVRVKKGDLPPIVTDLLDDILKQAGVGGAVVEQVLKDIKDVRLRRSTIKSLLQHSTRSLLGEAKKVLSISFKRDSRGRTIIPNNRPVVSDLLLHSSLALDREPRFLPITASKSYIADNKMVFMFIDVSGSMMDVWPNILAFCRALSKECDLRLFQFSTEVCEVSHRELKEGILKTTGGTCVEPVVEKIRELSQVSDAFIIIGDRYYAGPRKIDKPAKPVRLLDVCYNRGKESTAWFKDSKLSKVKSVWLDDEFEVHESPNENSQDKK